MRREKEHNNNNNNNNNNTNNNTNNNSNNNNNNKKKEAAITSQTQGGEDNHDNNNKKKAKDEIILKVNIHCAGCEDKIVKCLKGFEGVEDVKVNANEHRVVVKGKNADPLKVLERVRSNYSKHAQLISPTPKTPSADDIAKVKAKEKEDNEPLVMIVVLKVYIHCEQCAQEIKRSIEKMKGVQFVVADTKKSEMTVTGILKAQQVVDFLYKRAGKHASIVKEEYQDKEKARKRFSKLKKSGDHKDSDNDKTEESKKDVHYHYPPQYSLNYVNPCLTFSDENPNACSVM